jgi:hypothetical protein
MDAKQLQQQREAADQQNHVERIAWLSQPAPVWACGTPVDEGSRRMLLEQSRAAIAAKEAGKALEAAYPFGYRSSDREP